jgi:hypothetical protein
MNIVTDIMGGDFAPAAIAAGAILALKELPDDHTPVLSVSTGIYPPLNGVPGSSADDIKNFSAERRIKTGWYFSWKPSRKKTSEKCPQESDIPRRLNVAAIVSASLQRISFSVCACNIISSETAIKKYDTFVAGCGASRLPHITMKHSV